MNFYEIFILFNAILFSILEIQTDFCNFVINSSAYTKLTPSIAL